MANKRGFIFGSYNTAQQLWTLTEWELADAEYKQNFMDVPGRDGPLDMSGTLTGGEPRYGSRALTAVFECSEGTRLERKERIDTMVNWLSGWRVPITLPDDTTHYIMGRLQVQRLYNDMAHCSVQVSAVCDPWRLSTEETVVNLTATTEAQTQSLVNGGRKPLVPLVEITGNSAEVLLVFGTASWTLGTGTHQLPDLVLLHGSSLLTYSGTGDVKITYREAVL